MADKLTEIPDGVVCLFKVAEAETTATLAGLRKLCLTLRAVEWPAHYADVRDRFADGTIAKARLDAMGVTVPFAHVVAHTLRGKMFYSRVKRGTNRYVQLSTREEGAYGGYWPLMARPATVDVPPKGKAPYRVKSQEPVVLCIMCRLNARRGDALCRVCPRDICTGCHRQRHLYSRLGMDVDGRVPRLRPPNG